MARDLLGREINVAPVKEEVKKLAWFDFLKCILTKKDKLALLPHVKTSKYSQFMINNTLITKNFIDISTALNYIRIPNEAHFELLYNIIPKMQNGFMKYPFKQVKDKLLEAMQWKFKQRKEILYTYLEVMDEEDLVELEKEHKEFLKLTKKG